MMKHPTKHRGFAAAMTAALLVTICTGCGAGGGKGATLEVSFEHSYSSEELRIDEAAHLDGAISLNDTNLLMVGYDDDYNELFYVYNMTDSSVKEVRLAYLDDLPKGKAAWPNSMVIDPQGGISVIYYNYNEEDYEQLGYTLEVYDSEMNVVETRELDLDDDVNFNEIVNLPEGGYLASVWGENGNNYVAVLDKDFKVTKKIEGGFSYIQNLVALPDGSVYISYQDMEYNEVFGKINVEAGSVDKVEIEGLPSWFNECFASTTEDYAFYITNSDAIYGINIEDGTCTEVVNWLNSDFMGDYVNEPTQLKDGRFLVSAYDSNYENSSLWLLSPRDPEELKNVEVISLATLYTSQNLGSAVSEFNRGNDKYRIVVYDYNKFNTEDDWEAGQKQFESDLTSGIVADIICVNDSISFETLCNKGLFYDLTDFAQGLSDDTYFTNFFNSLEYGGKLYRMGFCFNVETLVAKTEHVGEGTKTMTEFTELIRNLPEDMAPFGGDMTKSNALYQLVMSNINSFVDVNAGTCTFNSQEFVDLLEFCDSFPAEGKDYNNMDDSDWSAYWADMDCRFINDKALFQNTWISDIKNEYRNKMTNFDSAPVTRTGYPVVDENDNGGRFSYDFLLSISSNSKYKDECWSFFEMMLSENYQEKLNWALPVSKSAFDKLAAKAMQPETYIQDGKEVEIELTVWRGDSEVKIPNMPQEYADELKAYISGVTQSNYYDAQISNIISEEAEMFFSGDQSAQQAADMIQSRAGLYLSEQH